MGIQYLHITGVVLTYWTISISMVFANKYLLGTAESGKDISLFVAWIQCIVSTLVVLFSSVTRGVMRRDWTRLKFRDGGPFVRPIMTMTCTYVGMLTFNNLCLKNVGVAFYQVARSLTLIFVVIFSVLLLKKKVSWKIVGCCLMVAAGFVLGVDQENLSGTLSISGVAFGIVTSLFVSLSGIFTKTALDAVERDSVKLTFYNNINAVILFLPFVLATGQLQTVLSSPEYLTSRFWFLLLVSGVLSFAIAWISAVQIDLTSPVTHHISANAKAVLQTLIAVLHGGDTKAALWWISILMVVGGALLYALQRMHEESLSPTPTTTTTKPSLRGASSKSVDFSEAADRNHNLTQMLHLIEEGKNKVPLDPGVLKGRDRSNTA